MTFLCVLIPNLREFLLSSLCAHTCMPLGSTETSKQIQFPGSAFTVLADRFALSELSCVFS